MRFRLRLGPPSVVERRAEEPTEDTMSDTTSAAAEAADAVVGALRDGTEERRAAASALLADDVAVFSPFGVGVGREAGDAALAHPRVVGMLQGAQWSTPEVDDHRVVVTATVGPGFPIGGFDFTLTVDDVGRITRFEQDLLPASPQSPAPIVLTDAHAALLDGAHANGTPPIVAYVDAHGVPKQSYRATVQVLDPQHLAIWIRDPAGGLVRALATNPHLSVFYSDRANGVTLQFVGRGHVESDEAVRDAVYAGSVKVEQDMDWRRGGVAVVIDVDRVEGRDASGAVLMASDLG
jgi:hypothetical protein